MISRRYITICQISGWARLSIQSWEAWELSGAFPWSLFSIAGPSGSRVLQQFSQPFHPCITKGRITLRWLACLGGFKWLHVHNFAKHRVKDFGPSLSKPFADCPLRSDRTWAEQRCEGKIDTKQSAFGSWGSRSFRRRHWSRADQFILVQCLRKSGPSIFGDGFGDSRIRTGVPQIYLPDLPQPLGGFAGNWELFRGLCYRVVGTAGLLTVPCSLSPRFEPLLHRLKNEATNLIPARSLLCWPS